VFIFLLEASLLDIRHALAFVLLGWFLMVTPLTQEWPWHPVSGAPLKHWYDKNDVAFASKQECEVDKQRVILHARNASADNDTRTLQLYYWMMLQCVASDDPRLGAK
jgi:hypothetical protein